MEQQGKWRTVGGRRVFIKDGQSLDEAMKESGKFNTNEFSNDDFVGLKGKEAIAKLLQEKKGHIKGAFTREDIGDIDLVWGIEGTEAKNYEDGYGLSHILKRREVTNQNIKKVTENLTNVIEKGNLKKQERKGKSLRFALEYEEYRAIVSTEMFGKNIQLVMTAFETNKKST